MGWGCTNLLARVLGGKGNVGVDYTRRQRRQSLTGVLVCDQIHISCRCSLEEKHGWQPVIEWSRTVRVNRHGRHFSRTLPLLNALPQFEVSSLCVCPG